MGGRKMVEDNGWSLLPLLWWQQPLCSHCYHAREAAVGVAYEPPLCGVQLLESDWSSLLNQVWHRTEGEVRIRYDLWTDLHGAAVPDHEETRHEWNFRCCSSQRTCHDNWGTIGV